jgi:hypothetical protein
MTLSKNQEWHWTEGNKYAVEGMKTLLLLNGGAALALLAFFGNRGKDAANSNEIVQAAGNALLMFGLGALSAGLVFIFGYLTQLEYGNENQPKASIWHNLTYGAILLSIVLFVGGIFFARSAVIASLTRVATAASTM